MLRSPCHCNLLPNTHKIVLGDVRIACVAFVQHRNQHGPYYFDHLVIPRDAASEVRLIQKVVALGQLPSLILDSSYPAENRSLMADNPIR